MWQRQRRNQTKKSSRNERGGPQTTDILTHQGSVRRSLSVGFFLFNLRSHLFGSKPLHLKARNSSSVHLPIFEAPGRMTSRSSGLKALTSPFVVDRARSPLNCCFERSCLHVGCKFHDDCTCRKFGRHELVQDRPVPAVVRPSGYDLHSRFLPLWRLVS